jgi:EAL domain-containing protein (putative c-di-GMP-specific phosphodiesterase class I)
VLRRLGCQLAQGYLFARPGPAEDISALLSVADHTHLVAALSN